MKIEQVKERFDFSPKHDIKSPCCFQECTHSLDSLLNHLTSVPHSFLWGILSHGKYTSWVRNDYNARFCVRSNSCPKSRPRFPTWSIICSIEWNGLPSVLKLSFHNYKCTHALYFFIHDNNTCAVHFRDDIMQICCADYEEVEDRCIGEYNMY